MNTGADLAGTRLGATEGEAIGIFQKDLLALPDMILKSLILYGSAAREDYRPGMSDINLLVVTGQVDMACLRNSLDPVFRGRQANLAPFFMTLEDIRFASDIFPLKFMAMKEAYRVLYGEDVLHNLEIHQGNAMIRIRQRISNMLLKMRRYYLANGGQRLTAMMSGQVRRFVETLGFLLRMEGIAAKDPDNIIEASARTFGLDGTVLKELYGLPAQETALPGEAAERLYGCFLEMLAEIAGRAGHR